MPMMTLRRLAVFLARAESLPRNEADIRQAAFACEMRQQERGSSKLSRRLQRKYRLGRAGAF